jgi:sugar phosphate isomerase/epimerase
MTHMLGFSTLGQSGATLDEIIGLAMRHNAPNVELRTADDELVHVGMTHAAADSVATRLRDAGVRILCLSSYVGLCEDSGSETSDTIVDDLAAHIRLGAALGAAGVRVFMRDADAGQTGGAALTDGEQRAIRRLGSVSDLVSKTGVRVLIETHDSHSAASRVARFMTAADGAIPSHDAKVLWDTAHTWSQGEEPAESFQLLRQWLAHLQIKDVATRVEPTPVALGAGSYPIDDLVTVLDGSDWRGRFVLEWERKWHPELPPLDVALDATHAWAHGLFELPQTA